MCGKKNNNNNDTRNALKYCTRIARVTGYVFIKGYSSWSPLSDTASARVNRVVSTKTLSLYIILRTATTTA